MLSHSKSCVSRTYDASSKRDKWGQHSWGRRKEQPWGRDWGGENLEKGTNGVSTNGVTANFVFFGRDLLGIPASLLLFAQKCQGGPLSPICQNPIHILILLLLLLIIIITTIIMIIIQINR